MFLNRSVTAIVSRQPVAVVGVSGLTAIESAIGKTIGKNEAKPISPVDGS